MQAVNAEATVGRGISASAVLVSAREVTGVTARGKVVQRVPLIVTENGTYNAPVGTAYTPVVANVADSLPWASDEEGGF